MTKNIRTFAFAFSLLLAALCLVPAQPALAQVTTTSTTLAAAMAVGDQTINLTSSTGVQAAGLAPVTGLYVDREYMEVASNVNASGTGNVWNVRRGSRRTAHASGATVWVGPPGYFDQGPMDPAGACTSTLVSNLPRPVVTTGDIMDCPTTGPLANQWVIKYRSGPAVQTPDGEFFVGPGNCWNTQSAHAGTAVGLGLVDGIPVIQGATANTASSDTITIACVIMPPFKTTTNKGVALVDAVFLYGNQTTNLGTQSATLASGTLNSQLVFSKFVAPTPGASETASSATLVRADSGTLAISPSAANFNVTAVSAGQFYSQKFTPATPIALSDATPIIFTVKLTVTDGAATQLNSPGVVVHYIEVPFFPPFGAPFDPRSSPRCRSR